ncbi:MAG: ABC transporter ATP-binding protein, partial [Lachnospiraceae bacterium]|nr:ABC transporter ATP-binding protein [Lachnospiraceae bacterium]
MSGTTKSRTPGKTLKRLLGYVWKDYKLPFVLVLICIAIGSLAGVIGNLFLKSLIDDYITPLLSQSSPNFAPLIRALLTMACIY